MVVNAYFDNPTNNVETAFFPVNRGMLNGGNIKKKKKTKKRKRKNFNTLCKS